MNISKIRENEEILRKLERILGTCSNLHENILAMINKETMYSSDEMLEDINIVSHHLNTIMTYCDPIFNYYLVVPNSVEIEERIIIMI
jgi:hypothetical protein